MHLPNNILSLKRKLGICMILDFCVVHLISLNPCLRCYYPCLLSKREQKHRLLRSPCKVVKLAGGGAIYTQGPLCWAVVPTCALCLESCPATFPLVYTSCLLPLNSPNFPPLPPLVFQLEWSSSVPQARQRHLGAPQTIPKCLETPPITMLGAQDRHGCVPRAMPAARGGIWLWGVARQRGGP